MFVVGDAACLVIRQEYDQLTHLEIRVNQVNLVYFSFFMLDAEEMGLDGCETQWSKTWDRTVFCVGAGTCNYPCRKEGFDNGECKKLTSCLCSNNCNGGGKLPQKYVNYLGLDGDQATKHLYITILICRHYRYPGYGYVGYSTLGM